MPKGKGWDLTSTNSLTAAAEWIRGRAGAQVVLVLREQDWVVAPDPQLTPLQIRDQVRDVLAPMLDVMLQGKGRR